MNTNIERDFQICISVPLRFVFVINLFRFYVTPYLNKQSLLEKYIIRFLINPHFPRLATQELVLMDILFVLMV